MHEQYLRHGSAGTVVSFLRARGGKHGRGKQHPRDTTHQHHQSVQANNARHGCKEGHTPLGLLIHEPGPLRSAPMPRIGPAVGRGRGRCVAAPRSCKPGLALTLLVIFVYSYLLRLDHLGCLTNVICTRFGQPTALSNVPLLSLAGLGGGVARAVCSLFGGWSVLLGPSPLRAWLLKTKKKKKKSIPSMALAAVWFAPLHRL